MTRVHEWETTKGLILIARNFGIGLTELDALRFQDDYRSLLYQGTVAKNATGFVERGHCWAHGSFPLVLKHLMLPYSNALALPPRPQAKPGRTFYSLDDFARSATITMASLETSARGGDEMSWGQEIAYRKWEDHRFHFLNEVAEP